MIKVRRHAWWIYLLFFFISQLSSVVIPIVWKILLPSHSNSEMLAVTLLTANLLGIILFFCHRPQSITWSSTLGGLRGSNGRRTGLVLLLALPVMILTNLGQEALLPNLPDLVGTDTFKGIMDNPLGLLTICVVGPLCEELLFRGGVQTDLTVHHSDQGWQMPIAISALVFSLIHLNPVQMPVAFLLGLLLGYAFWWTGSLVAPVCIHVFNNSLACLLSFLSPDDESLIHILGGRMNAGILAVVSLFFLWIIVRAVRREDQKTA